MSRPPVGKSVEYSASVSSTFSRCRLTIRLETLWPEVSEVISRIISTAGVVSSNASSFFTWMLKLAEVAAVAGSRPIRFGESRTVIHDEQASLFSRRGSQSPPHSAGSHPAPFGRQPSGLSVSTLTQLRTATTSCRSSGSFEWKATAYSISSSASMYRSG